VEEKFIKQTVPDQLANNGVINAQCSSRLSEWLLHLAAVGRRIKITAGKHYPAAGT